MNLNLKLLRLQLLFASFFSLLLLVEWLWGSMDKRELESGLQYSQVEGNVDIELPTPPDTENADAHELIERPLFTEGRRPVSETPVVVEENVEIGQIDDWSLVGVYNKGKQPYAMFNKRNEPKKHLKVTNGQAVSGWMLKEIQSDRVILQQAGQDKQVPLRKPREDTPPAPPVPASQPGPRGAKPIKPGFNPNANPQARPGPGRPPIPNQNPKSENENDESAEN